MVGGELPELPLNVAQVSFMTRTECSLPSRSHRRRPGRHDNSPFPRFFFFSDRHFLRFLCCFETLFVRYSFTVPHSVHTTLSFSKTQQKGIRDFAWMTCPRFCNCLFHVSLTGLSHCYHRTFASLHSEWHLISHNLSFP